MAKSLLDLRFIIENQTKPFSLDNEDVIIWGNEVNADIGLSINVPSSENIALNTTDLQYALPADLKIINRLQLQSVIDEGIDAEFGIDYRIYNGNIVFPHVIWIAPDALVVDYYKHLTTFTSITDEIELDDRYVPIYQFYGLMKFYEIPAVIEKIGDQAANRRMLSYERKYEDMKNKLTSYQMLSNEPVVIDGRW
jgi:hypothetical protein